MTRIASMFLFAALLAVSAYAAARLQPATTPVRAVGSVVTDTATAQPVAAKLIQFRRHADTSGLDRVFVLTADQR